MSTQIRNEIIELETKLGKGKINEKDIDDSSNDNNNNDDSTSSIKDTNY